MRWVALHHIRSEKLDDTLCLFFHAHVVAMTLFRGPGPRFERRAIIEEASVLACDEVLGSV